MKKFTLFLLTMVLSVVGAISSFAGEKPVPTFSELNTDGTVAQYLYNVEFDGFLVGANDWGTRASVDPTKALKVTISAVDGGTFKIGEMSPDNADGVWIDGAREGNDKFTITLGENKTFTIGCTKFADTYLTWGGDPADTKLNFTATATNGTWAAVSESDYADYIAALKKYKQEENGIIRVKADTEFTGEVAELDGKTLVLVDAESSDKLLCNIGDNQDMVATSLSELEGTEFIYTKFAKADVEVEGVEGDIFTMQMLNKDGANFSKWGTDGYVNFQPEGQNVVFALGLDKDGSRIWGQDGPNLGLWTVEKTENGYVIKNVGRNNYFNHSAAVTTTAEPVYFKFYAETEFYKPTTPDPEPKQLTAGDYFIINAESGKFLNGNNAWGTKASVTEAAQLMTIAVLEDGTYTIDSHISNGGANHFVNAGENLFVDGAASAQTIAEISDGIFSIKDVNGKFLAADAEGIVNFNAEDATSAAAQWKIVTKDELIAQFDNATEENPVNANFLISDANFGRNNTYNSAWQGDKPAFGGVNYSKGEFTPAGQIAEVWGGNVKKATDYYQEIEVPNGIYTLTVQGFYRYNNTDENTNDVAQTAHADGTEVIYSKLYANSDTVSLKSLFDEEVVAAAEADETVKVPFNLTEAGNAFAKGFYVNTVKVAVKTGVLKFGVTKTEHIGTDWTVWDNFRLTYIGKLDEPVPAIDEAIAKLDLALKAANEKLASYAAGDALFQYSEAELAPLANAIAAANEAKAAEDATEESVNNARTALNEAVEAFAPKANAPKEGQAYILSLTTADNNQLSVSADGIKIEAEGTPVYFVAQENGYAISNGTEYVNYEGSNNWTMTASAEAYGWTIALADGGYSITGKNGLLGTNANETAAGSPCYGDKKTSNGNYIWAIAEYVAPEPVNTHENDLRLPLTGGSGEGTELAIEVLESNEDGQPLSAKYTITNGTWGNNASHLSIFKYNLTPDMIKGYKSVIVEFAEALPVSEGNPEYNFIPCGFVCPEGWVDLDGKDVFELEFTDKQKTEGIADFSIFFNANGDVKNATFTIKGLWLVKDATEQPDAIDTVEASENATSVKKMMVDGKIVIVKGGKTYNVAGSLIK